MKIQMGFKAYNNNPKLSCHDTRAQRRAQQSIIHIVVLTDRNDLDGQLFDNFARYSEILGNETLRLMAV
jgi:hypothetical protein